MSEHPASPESWRLVITPSAGGAWNMAVDEAIAGHASSGDVPPTLRLYQWQPPCVSLGRHQPLADINLLRCQALGYDVVRRPTGGRAILHTDELTYSVAGPQAHPVLAGAVLDSYLRLSQGLLAGLARLGLAVSKAPATSRAQTVDRVGVPAVARSTPGPICFEVPSAYEIVAGGKKLVGSAQSRRQGWVLQHGTLPLVGDVTRLVEALALEDEGKRPQLRADLAGRATTVEAVLGRPVSFEEAGAALIAGFEEALGIRLERGELTAQELLLAGELVAEKYAAEPWIARF